MTKRILVTAGPVYGSLDDNKLVSNRSRGMWATKFAAKLSEKHDVALLVADIARREIEWYLSKDERRRVDFHVHNGFDEYRNLCYLLAAQVDTMILAAAVVNWIPKKPYSGKMPTEGYLPGSIISVPFVLAPRVIGEMKALNPKLTLIGCKMAVGADDETLVAAAYNGVLVPARCNAVVANDLQRLRTKLVVYPDRSVHRYEDDFPGFFEDLQAVVEDEYWTTAQDGKLPDTLALARARTLFDRIATEYRKRFVGVGDRVFGSFAVRVEGAGWLVTPRKKHRDFTANDAVFADTFDIGTKMIRTAGGKATLNAPLLMRVSTKYNAHVVLHLHEPLSMVYTEPYAPPGTVRDNERPIPAAAFYIRNHGFVKCLWE